MPLFTRARLRRALLAGLTAPLLALSACTPENVVQHQSVGAVEQSKYKISGKVTYKGSPVPYGYVLFYSQESTDTKTGRMATPAFGEIKEDGTFEVSGAAVGMNMVAVVTDPDVEMRELLTPKQVGGGMPSLPPGAAAPPGAGGPPGGGPPGGGPPGGGPPGGGPPGGLPGGGPPGMPGGGPGGGPPGGGPPKMPSGPDAPKFAKNPRAEKLTDAERKTLKEMNDLYATPGTSALVFHVTGEGDQKYDLNLPLKGGN